MKYCWLTLLLVVVVAGAWVIDSRDSSALGRDPILAGRSYGVWIELIRPKPDELAWLEIPWLPTFAEGIRASHEHQKPLLLWVMNGHPLGCT